jgi:hypothetical protein
MQARRFGLIRVRSPLLAESLSCFLFLWVLRWFTSPRSPPPTYGFSRGSLGMTQGGLPHSEIAGSKLVCSSPTLIAAYHVLHRLLAPRHSPYALSSLTINQPGCVLLSMLQYLYCSLIAPHTRNSHALRVVVGKNYRLQDIQLSKNSRAACAAREQIWWRIPGSNR